MAKYKFIIIYASLHLPFAVFIFFISIAWQIPAIELINKNPSTIYTDKLGNIIYQELSIDDYWYFETSINDYPEYLIPIILAAEDNRFYEHPGFDIFALMRAIVSNVKAGRILSGASTITMQVVKMHGVRVETIYDKLIQMLAAYKSELKFSKKTILEYYLNNIPLGHNYIGIEAAAFGYFNKKAKFLSAGESLMLAAIIRSPTKLNPRKNYQANLLIQKKILNNIKNNSVILNTLKKSFSKTNKNKFKNKIKLENNSKNKNKSKNKFIKINSNRFANLNFTKLKEIFLSKEVSIAPRKLKLAHFHFIKALKKYHPNIKGHLGKIKTSLNKNWQILILNIIKRHLKKVQRNKNINSAAVIVLDNKNTSWVAWAMASSYYAKNEKLINIPLVLRQPGSTLKPFLYSHALLSSHAKNYFSAATILPDLPPDAYPSYGNYSPRNYSDEYFGPVRLRTALVNSLNVPAVFTLNKIGIYSFLEKIKSGPFTNFYHSADYYGLGFALGNAEVSLKELVEAYSALANSGTLYKSSFIENNKRVKNKQWLDSEVAFIITDILKDKEEMKLSFGENNIFAQLKNFAIKTGTSEGFRDNFVIGYSKDYTIGVWVGNLNRKPMINSSGISGAGPIFKDVALLLPIRLNDNKNEIIKHRLISKKICRLSGMPAGPLCPNLKSEYFRIYNVPLDKCNYHFKNSGNDDVQIKYPPGYEIWVAKYLQIKGWPGENITPIKIISPANYAVFKINPDIPIKYQKIIFSSNKVDIKWYLNNKLVAHNKSKVLNWQLKPGDWVLYAAQGEYTDSVSFSVLTEEVK